MTASTVLQVISALCVIGGLSWAVWMFKLQTTTQLFINFTQRYHQIRSQLPNQHSRVLTRFATQDDYTSEVEATLLDYVLAVRLSVSLPDAADTIGMADLRALCSVSKRA